MDSQDQRNAVKTVLSVLRKATRIVQLAPFVYLAVYAAYMLSEPGVGENLACVADSLLSVRPITIGGMLVLSHLFKLCAWHKAACLLPGLSQVEGVVDNYFFVFTENEIICINAVIGLSALVFLVLAVRHFAHGFKGHRKAYA